MNYFPLHLSLYISNFFLLLFFWVFVRSRARDIFDFFPVLFLKSISYGCTFWCCNWQMFVVIFVPGLLASRVGDIYHWETRPLGSCYDLCLTDFYLTNYWKACYGLVMIEHTLQKLEDVLWQLGHSSLHAPKTRFFWDLYALRKSFNCFHTALEILICVNDDFMIWFSLVHLVQLNTWAATKFACQ